MAEKSFQLPPSLQHKLVQAAMEYAAYKAFKDANPPGDARVLQTLQRIYGKDLLDFFGAIDRQPPLVQLMKDLQASQILTPAPPSIGPANPKALKESPGATLLHGLQNMTSGLLGTFGQALGQYAYPNDLQKANAVGDIFKNIGDMVDALHDAKSKSDFAKEKLIETQLGKVTDAMVMKVSPEKTSDKKEFKEKWDQFDKH